VRRNRTLPKILKLKDNRKKELEIEVKKAADRVDEEESRLRELEKRYTDTLRIFDEKQSGGGMDAKDITSYYNFFSRINVMIDEQRRIHSRCRDELRMLKDTLVTAHRDKKMFEILNDRAVRGETREREVSERKETDFFTLTRKLR